MKDQIQDVFKIVGMLVIWGLALTIGLTVFATLAGAIVAFASTGIGAIILVIVVWRWWSKHKNDR